MKVMKTYACRKMGIDCGWKYTARTEDLLADMAAVHLREVHNMPSLGSDMVARLKRSFSDPSPAEAAKAEELVVKEFRCNDLIKGCAWHYIAQTEELIVDGVAVHAREAHGIKEFTPELKAKVENSLHVWKG
jgi:predicted small metal-binding protein